MTMHKVMTFDASIWQGRDDTGERGDVTRLFQVVRSAYVTALSGAPAVLGFACDAGVLRNHGRAGSAQAPREIRRALANVPAHGLAVLADAGDVTCDDGDLEGAQAALGDAVFDLLDAGARPVVLGGGHEVAFGTYQGLRKHAGVWPSSTLTRISICARAAPATPAHRSTRSPKTVPRTVST